MSVTMDPKQLEEIIRSVVSKMSPQTSSLIDAGYPAGQFNEKLGEGGVEPFDLDYGMMDISLKKELSPYPRVNRVLKRVHAAIKGVDDERAMLVTEADQKFSGPQIIRQAKILEHILDNITIRIYPDELIVGEMAAPSRYAPVFPEFSYGWVEDELKNQPFDERDSDNFALTPECKKNLLSIADYWRGKTVEDYVFSILDDEEVKGSASGGRGVFFPNLYLYGGIGHLIPRYQKLFALGYKGIKKQIEDCMAAVNTTDPDSADKRAFYAAELITVDASMRFFKRYAKLAAEMAAKESDSTRKGELEQIAANLEWVSENPPRYFWEALQLYHLATNIILIESNGHSISYGRFDQLLNPYYVKDMEEGRITKARTGELIELFFIKIYELNKVRDRGTSILNTEVGMGGTCLLVGGMGIDGKDATNDVTHLSIEAHVHTQLPDPWFAVRWHEHAPWDYKVKVINSIKVGTGQPKIFNDDAIIPASIYAGRTVEESRDYGITGCVEVDSCGKENGYHDAGYFAMSKVFELAINHGRCVDCGPACHRFSICGGAGKSLGPDTGGLIGATSFEDILESYEKQMEYWVAKAITFNNTIEIAHARMKPLPYTSLLIEDCVANGVEINAGGAKYNFSGPQAVGTGTVADGLCTIKQLIFEEKRITAEELLDAVKNNWKGHEALYTLINSDKVHHYGNDDDYADDLATYCTNVYVDQVLRYNNTRGGRVIPGIYCVSGNVGVGLFQGASIDGRIAQEPVSNCLGPVHTKVGCHDVKGPTAMANSAAKLDQIKAANGTLMNVRFTPACVSGTTGRDNFIHYVDSYFSKGGFHCQFNIASKETLLDAQRHPEKYPGLLVRVAGYSAYFVKISKELQDDLIGRNEYSSFD